MTTDQITIDEMQEGSYAETDRDNNLAINENNGGCGVSQCCCGGVRVVRGGGERTLRTRLNEHRARPDRMDVIGGGTVPPTF